jgi:hypothetical protein
LEALGHRVQMFFELQNQRNHVGGLGLLWVLKCLLNRLPNLGPFWV